MNHNEKIQDTMIPNCPSQMAPTDNGKKEDECTKMVNFVLVDYNMTEKTELSTDPDTNELGMTSMNNQQPNLQNQPVAGNQDIVVKAFGFNEFEDEIFPICEDKPFFDIVLAKSNVKPLYRMGFPDAICPLLPSSKVPAVLTSNSKTWKTVLIGNIERKKFESDTWRKFVNDNNLKVDDCLVFQTMESGADEIRFAVQILRGEFPSELEDLVTANTVNID